jgi:Methane oxygenase PmoA
MVGNRKMLDEINMVSVAERDGVYVLDLEYRLTPVVDYFLDRASFGGFDVQCRKDGESYYANAAGKAPLPDPHYSDPELNWPSAPWYDYTIRLSNGKTLGAAVIDHAGNPPTAWHNSTHLWMLNPTITGAGPQTIKQGATMTLRYRVVTHDGATPTDLPQKLSTEWRTR